jgi:pyruvate,orthophosphate dikinase
VATRKKKTAEKGAKTKTTKKKTKTVKIGVKTKEPPKPSTNKEDLAEKKMFYSFGGGKAEGNGTMKDVLGGKGAGLAEMTNAGINVPPGFTISTDACLLYYESNLSLPRSFEKEMKKAMQRLEKQMGMTFGDPNDPLLVSVRSGAKISMPGMMDTVLNLGLNDETVKGFIAKTDDPRFVYDLYRRFISMFGNVVLGIDGDLFEEIITKKKKQRRVKHDSSLSVEDLKSIVKQFLKLVEEKSGEPFPADPWEQLRLSRNAVFRSWNAPRAISYRTHHDIPSDLGTAVNVQAMVYGPMGVNSATGVGFTRNPATGEKEFYGEFLVNAQGEDVVAGIRTPQPISELEDVMP